MTTEELQDIEARLRDNKCTNADVRSLLNEVQKMEAIKAEPFRAGGELKALEGRTVYIRRDTQDEMAYREVVIENEYILPDQFEPTDTILDIGANIGSFALACVARGCGNVYCFEPDALNFSVLVENTRDLKQISRYQLAVWRSDEVEPVRLVQQAPHETAMSYVNPGLSGSPCASIGMDKILSKFSSIRLMKIDAEGAEWPIFHTSIKLGVCQEIIAEIHYKMKQTRFPVDPDMVMKRLKEFGFSCAVVPHPTSPDVMGYLRAVKADG